MMTRILLVYALEHPKLAINKVNDLVAAMLFLLSRRMEMEDPGDASAEGISSQSTSKKSTTGGNIIQC